MAWSDRPSGVSNQRMISNRGVVEGETLTAGVLPFTLRDMPTVLHARAFQDNYIWMIRNDAGTDVVAVDPGDAAPVLAFLERNRLRLAAILCTHHHADHVGGVTELTRAHP